MLPPMKDNRELADPNVPPFEEIASVGRPRVEAYSVQSFQEDRARLIFPRVLPLIPAEIGRSLRIST